MSDLMKEVEQELKDKAETKIFAIEIAKLFKGKPVKICMIALSQIEDLIKQESIY